MREEHPSFLFNYLEIAATINNKFKSLFKKQAHLEWRSFYDDENQAINTASILRMREVGVSYDSKGMKHQLVRSKYQVLPGLLTQHEFHLKDCDKVFASHWVSDNQLVLSTKSSNLIILDVYTGKRVQLPVLNTQVETSTQDCVAKACGIYGISVNSSRTLLATGSADNKNIVVYRLPTFEPLAILQGHQDLVFSLKWTSDNTLVSGSRDHSVASWTIPDGLLPVRIEERLPVFQPETLKHEHSGKVRSLQVNDHTTELFTLSSDGTCKIWDANYLTPRSVYNLYESNEAVCTACDSSKNLFAVGSQTLVSLIDPRIEAGNVHTIPSNDDGFGVRSLEWKGPQMIIGGGLGRISFYDLRNQKYIPLNKPTSEDPCSAQTYFQSGKGWLNEDHIYHSFFHGNRIPNAVYTLSYDSTQTKLFAAGGPLQLGLKGSYAAIFE